MPYHSEADRRTDDMAGHGSRLPSSSPAVDLSPNCSSSFRPVTPCQKVVIEAGQPPRVGHVAAGPPRCEPGSFVLPNPPRHGRILHRPPLTYSPAPPGGHLNSLRRCPESESRLETYERPVLLVYRRNFGLRTVWKGRRTCCAVDDCHVSQEVYAHPPSLLALDQRVNCSLNDNSLFHGENCRFSLCFYRSFVTCNPIT